jgi:two-component system OmpR family response regulator
MHNTGRVLTRPQIIEQVWDYGYAIEPSGVETYISYLRRKLDDREGRLIRTVRGVGYALHAPEPAPPGGEER